MRIRFFGQPWPNEERRASICEDDRFKVPVPVGEKCIECSEVIKDNQRGVITACSMRVWGHFWLDLPETEDDPAAKMPVAAYHLGCWLKEVVGGEMSEKIQKRMHLRPGDVPLTPREIDELEEQGLSVGEEDATPGGWFE